MNILTPVAIAEMLHMSERWVYLHAAELGASRIGGSWIFTEEGLIDALQRARRLESIRQDRRGKKASVVSIKEGSLGVGRKNKKRPKDAEIEDLKNLKKIKKYWSERDRPDLVA